MSLISQNSDSKVSDVLALIIQVVDHVPVIQLETPAGSIVENFAKPKVLRVPRNRMRNVKNTANLFPLQLQRE